VSVLSSFSIISRARTRPRRLILLISSSARYIAMSGAERLTRTPLFLPSDIEDSPPLGEEEEDVPEAVTGVDQDATMESTRALPAQSAPDVATLSRVRRSAGRLSPPLSALSLRIGHPPQVRVGAFAR
jgi:hypothetical protein